MDGDKVVDFPASKQRLQSEVRAIQRQIEADKLLTANEASEAEQRKLKEEKEKH